MGDEAVHRVGPRQRPPGALRVRPGLEASSASRRTSIAPETAADHRLPAHVFAVDQGPGHRRVDARRHPNRGRLREVRAASCAARSCCRSRPGACACSTDRVVLRMNDEGHRGGADHADPGSRLPAAGARRRRRRSTRRSRSSTSPKAWRRCSSAARTAILSAGGSDCRGRRSAWTAARVARRAAAAAIRRRRAGAVGDDRRRALQPHGAHARQGPAGAGRGEHPDDVLSGSGRGRRTASTRSPRFRGPISRTKS